MNNLRKALMENSVKYIAVKTREPTVNSLGLATYRPVDKNKCMAYFQEFLLFDQEVIDAEPGVYTWILKDFGASLGRHLIASRTYSGQELGTLHLNLNQFTKPGRIIIAGELSINEGVNGQKTHTFNILSGTYSAELTEVQQKTGIESLRKYVRTFGIEPNITPYEKILEAPGFVLPQLPSYLEKNYLEICTRSAYVPPKKGGARHKGSRFARRTRTHRKGSRTARRTLKHGR